MIIDMPSDFLAGALEITEEEANAILARANSIVAGDVTPA
jgi:hypothetical protein